MQIEVPMTNRIQGLIHQHFLEGRRTSLMASVIQNWTDDDIPDALEVRHRAVRKLAFDRLLKLFSEGDPTCFIIEGLRGSASMKNGFLLALSALPVESHQQIEQLVSDALDDDDAQVRSSAARVIAFRFPRSAGLLLQLRGRPGFAEILRHLCYSGRVEMIPEIAQVAGFPEQRLPPSIGVLVDQYWLADNFSRHQALVNHLADACGFSNIPVKDEVLNLWKQGLNCVTEEILKADCNEVRERLQQFGWQFLPESFAMSPAEEVAVNVHDSIDRGLFLSAIREADREQISLLRTRHPFSIQFQPAAANAICCHAKLYFAEQLFIERATKLTEELQIPSQRHGEFWIDHARTQLILDVDERAESESILRARWSVRSRGIGAVRNLRLPVVRDDDFTEAKHLVLDRIPTLSVDDRFCSGTRSIINLSNATAIDGIGDWLAEEESKWKSKLIPIGMELQVPIMNVNRIMAWKQTLRYLGVNSPRRPEYHKMTEAAFLPVPSFHAAILGPLLLHHLGMIEYPQDMAMHLSFQGDLCESVRYLAFPQLFIHPSKRSRKRAPWTISPLMSKGLVNLNEDVVDCDPSLPATCRTEIRIFRCVAEEREGDLEITKAFIDDVIANHLLASAIQSDNKGSKECLNRYFAEVEKYAAQLGDNFIELLHANYYEATGEPEDVAMLDYLPVLQKRKDAREQLGNAEDAVSVQQQFLRMRTKCVRQLVDLWFGEKESGLVFSETACNLKIPAFQTR